VGVLFLTEQKKVRRPDMIKSLLILLACLFFLSCATAGKMNHLNVGMTEAEVIALLGQPVSISASQDVKYLNYRFSETSDDAFIGVTSPYFVQIKDGKVSAFGRRGDFGTTSFPSQKIILEKQ
jgi:hypothetical protein